MKYVNWIFVVLFVSSLTSFVEKDKPVMGLNVGDVAPNFKIQPTLGEQPFELRKLKGKYVLLSFWASYDAPSRMRNVQLNNKLQDVTSDVELVSVSFDEYESIFNETIRKDQITSPTCFVETEGESSTVFKAYHLNKGFDNYLLNENGTIIAKNVPASDLINYLD